MIVDKDFMTCLQNFPMGKGHVYCAGTRFRTYREIFDDRAKRELCIAVSEDTNEVHSSFNLYHTSKTVRLKPSEGSVQTAIDFIKGFTIDAPTPSPKNAKKRRFFKLL